MGQVALNVGLVLVFVLIGGFFAASELALVSLREAQVRAIAEKGKRGRRVAELHADPNRFLAAVQVGVTFAGFLSAAFGASTLADDASELLVDWGVSDGVATPLALVVITLIISYVSLVLGELVPKRLALQRAEGIALGVAGTVDRLAKIVRPFIWLLSISTNAVVRLFGINPHAPREDISSEELRVMLASHTGLSAEERQIVEDVFDAEGRTVREVMVPRTEVTFLDSSVSVSDALTTAAELPHSRYPVMRGAADDIVGFVHVRDLVKWNFVGSETSVGAIVRPVMSLPWTKGVLPAMSEMRREGRHLAMVVDEYGGTAGIVTLEDLVEELVGDIRDEYDLANDDALDVGGGDTEVDGLLNLDDMQEATGLELPDGPYETVAGFVMSELGRLPKVDDTVEIAGRTLTVVALDGRRVDRVRVSRPVPRREPSEDEGSAEHDPA